MGRFMSDRRRSGWAASASMLLAASATLSAGTPPAGFIDTELVPTGGTGGVQDPTAIAYEPGAGHLWIVEQGGRVRRRDASSGTVTTALTLDCVDSDGERGGLGIAFAPEFLDGPTTRHVYLYYTREITSGGNCAGQPTGVRNQVSRFLESNGTLSGEEVILAGPALSSQTNHNGGAIRFASDGTLFIAMGDNDTDASANPASRNLGDLRGKLLRVDADGDSPADNPFFGQAGVRPEIWAWGLRNPFRFSIDSATDTPFIGDVGENTWEAVYVGVPGADYGYPCFEGGEPFQNCNPEPAPGSVTAPVFVYGHASQTPPVSGETVIGGPVYRATAFPADYQGDYFFGDYVDGWIRRASVTPALGLENVQMFMPDAPAVVDMIVSPAGCLTWVSYTTGVRNVCFNSGNQDLDRDGFTPNGGDCDDSSQAVFPGAPEVCDGLDNDCNGGDDDGLCSDFNVNGDARVDGVELSWIGRAFTECSATPVWWSSVDYSKDGCIDGDDLSVLTAAFGCAGSEPICE